MGNLNAFGGPLPASWHNYTVQLQHKILQRMRTFGMTPILPAFAGHIPAGLIDVYGSNISYSRGTWHGFAPTFLLDPLDPLFQEIGSSFVTEYTAEFGTDHLYNCDAFNEMDPEVKKRGK